MIMNEETGTGCLKSSPLTHREVFRRHVLSSLLVDLTHIPTDYKGLPQVGSCVLPFYTLNSSTPASLSLTSRSFDMEDATSSIDDANLDVYSCSSPCEYYDRNPQNCCCDCKRRHPFFAISFPPAFGVTSTEVINESTARSQIVNDVSPCGISALSKYKRREETVSAVPRAELHAHDDLLTSFHTSKIITERELDSTPTDLKCKIRCPSHRKKFCTESYTHLSVCPGLQNNDLHRTPPWIDRDTSDTPCAGAGGEQEIWSSKSISLPTTCLSAFSNSAIFRSQSEHDSTEDMENIKDAKEVPSSCAESVFSYPLEVETNSESSSGAFPAFLFPSSKNPLLARQVDQKDILQQKERDRVGKCGESHSSSHQELCFFDTGSTSAVLADSFSVSSQSEGALSRILSRCHSELPPQPPLQSQSQFLTSQSRTSPISNLTGFATRPASASSVLPAVPSLVVPSLVGRQYQRYDGNTRLVVGSIPYRILQIPTVLSLTPVNGVKIEFPVMCTRVQFLLVSSSRADEWIFPKGGWEVFETCEEGARRETLEESGAIGLDHTLRDVFKQPFDELEFTFEKGENTHQRQDKDKNKDEDKSEGKTRCYSTAYSRTHSASPFEIFHGKKEHIGNSSLAYSCSVPFKSEKAERAQKSHTDGAITTPVKGKSPKVVAPSSSLSSSKTVGANCLITFLLRTGTACSQFAEDERQRTWLSVEEVSTILRRPHMLTAFSYTLSKAQDEFILASKASKKTEENDTFCALYEALQAESTWEAFIALCEACKVTVSLKPQPIGDIGVDYLSSLVISSDSHASPFTTLYCNEQNEVAEGVEDAKASSCISSLNLRPFFGSNDTKSPLTFPEVYSELLSELPPTLATSDVASLEANKLAREVALLAQRWVFNNQNKGLHAAYSQTRPCKSKYSSLNEVKRILRAAVEISTEITQDRVSHAKQRREQRKSPEAFIHSIQQLTEASGGIKPRPDDTTLHLLSQTALKESKVVIPGRLKKQIE